MNFHQRGPGNLCLLFDLSSGGGGPSSNVIIPTVSGSGKSVAGNHNQFTESGALSVGQKGKYIETGALDLSGQKISVGKGGSLTLNQAPAPATVSSGLNGSPQPIANPAPAPSPDTSGSAAPVSATSDTHTAAAPGSGLWSNIKTFWSSISIWQKIGGAVVLALVLWLVFHKRSK